MRVSRIQKAVPIAVTALAFAGSIVIAPSAHAGAPVLSGNKLVDTTSNPGCNP